MDWHSYDYGAISGLRVSMMTGSRALPLLWYEIKTSESKSRRTAIEQAALRDLLKYRPTGVTWLVLLDAGFSAPELLDLLEEMGYYVIRSGSKVVVHSGPCCWTNIGKLPVSVGQIVEFCSSGGLRLERWAGAGVRQLRRTSPARTGPSNSA